MSRIATADLFSGNIGFDEDCLLLLDSRGATRSRKHESELIPSATFSDGANLSRAAGKNHLYRTSDAKLTSFYYSQEEKSWLVAERDLDGYLEDLIDCLSVDPIDELDIQSLAKTPIDICSNPTLTSLDLSTYEFADVKLCEDGNAIFYKCFLAPYGETVRHNVGRLALQYSPVREHTCRLSIHDSATDKWYLFLCEEDESDKKTWFQCHNKPSHLEAVEYSTVKFDIGMFLFGLGCLAVCLLLAYCFRNQILKFEWSSFGFHWLPMLIGMVATFFSMIIVCFPFDELEHSQRGYSIRIGEFEFHGNGGVNYGGRFKHFALEFSDSFDGYDITSLGNRTIGLTGKGLAARISQADGIVKLESQEDSFLSPYDPRDPFCVFDPHKEENGAHFEQVRGRTGKAKPGYTDVSANLRSSEIVGGVEIIDNGDILMGDVMVSLDEPLPQTTFGELLVSKVRHYGEDSLWALRIVQPDTDVAWFYTYNEYDSCFCWERLRWTRS